MYKTLLPLVSRRSHLESKRERTKHQEAPEDSCDSAELPSGLSPSALLYKEEMLVGPLVRMCVIFMHQKLTMDLIYVNIYVLIKIAVNSSVRMETEPPIDFFNF